MTENLGGLFGGAALGNLNLASAPATEAAPAAEVEADATVHNVIIVGSGPLVTPQQSTRHAPS